MIFSFASTISLGRSQQRLMLVCPERQVCLGGPEGIEGIRESGSTELVQQGHWQRDR